MAGEGEAVAIGVRGEAEGEKKLGFIFFLLFFFIYCNNCRKVLALYSLTTLVLSVFDTGVLRCEFFFSFHTRNYNFFINYSIFLIL